MSVPSPSSMMSRCALLAVIAAVHGCSDWIMDDQFGLSVRTMDLGVGPHFALRTVPRGLKDPKGQPAKHGALVSVMVGNGTAHSGLSKVLLSNDVVAAGLNEAGLSCDLHALLNSSYPAPSNSSADLSLYLLCNWALANFASVDEVKSALSSGRVHLWGPPDGGADGVHFILRDSTGMGVAVEFMERSTKVYEDGNDGVTGVGVFTNEPEYPWQVGNVRHYLWKQSLARPATAMPGACARCPTLLTLLSPPCFTILTPQRPRPGRARKSRSTYTTCQVRGIPTSAFCASSSPSLPCPSR